MKRFARLLGWGLVLGAVGAVSFAGACNDKTLPTPDGEGAGGGEPTKHPFIEGKEEGTPRAEGASMKMVPGPGASEEGSFEYVLREGTPDADKRPTAPPVEAKPLTDADAQKILDRLPKIGSEDGDVVEFALREGSKPPPLTGGVIEANFPPPAPPAIAAPDITQVPPAVLRYQPEGDVPLAPRITVTFATPMVAITSHDTLAKEAVPAKLSPTIEGNWRWVGTKTLFFDPVGRAPMATEFKVEVPAGVKDALGNALAQGKTFTFKTPPPSVRQSAPQGDSVQLEPVFYVLFDQKVDPNAIREKVKVTAGGKTLKVRALTADEEKKEAQAWIDDRDNVGRWVAWKLVEKLPKDTQVSVVFPKGLPSAEGPRTTEQDLSYSFKTYGPFKVKEARCGWRDECYAGMPFQIEFTNPVDEDALDPKQITVDPALAGFQADASWTSISLRGRTKGKESYKVKLDPGIKDIYGQTLGDSDTMNWRVGPSRAILAGQLKNMTVLDPIAQKRRLPVYVVNMKQIEVQLYKVTPADWPAYLAFLQDRWRDDAPKTPPGKKVFDQKIDTGAPEEEFFEVGIDLAPALDGEFGQLIAVIRPTVFENKWERDRMSTISWVQATKIGLDALSDNEGLTAWATNLSNGKPLEGVEVTLTPPGTIAKTDAHGLASLDLPGAAGTQVLLAKQGGDLAFLPDNLYGGDSGSWIKQSHGDELRWMIFDDRHLYRPDETVSVKGAVRNIKAGKKGDVALLPAGSLTKVTWRATDSQGNEIGKGDANVSALGTFNFALKLPKTPNLGSASIVLSPGSSSEGQAYHSFEIQEFRRPEFEVASVASEGPHFVGGSGLATITATYFAGGPLPNAPVHWSVSTSPTNFTPPNHDTFVFGKWVPWWGWRSDYGGHGGGNTQAFEGRTDSAGTHRLGLDFKGVTPPRPTSVVAEATVEDVNRQTWSTTTTLLVHPSSNYVGLKTDRWFVETGKPIEVQVVVADIEGKRQEGVPVTVKAARLEWKKVKKVGWTEVEEDVEECKVNSAKDVVTCKFLPKAGGRHRIVATVSDKDKRPNETELSVWVPGGKQPADRELKEEAVVLIPSKKTYAVGDVAEVLVQAPFSPAEGVWTLKREGIVKTTPFTIEKDAATIKVPIEDWMIPGVSIAVFLNGEADRVGDDGKPNPKLPKRPAFAVGTIDLSVPPVSRTLSVTAEPLAPKTEPGADTAVDVTVKDASGKAVADAEVALVVVDESVLALTGYAFPDPIAAFYTGRPDFTRTERLRSYVMLAALAELYGQAGNQQMEEEMGKMEKASGGARREMAADAAMPMPAPTAAMAKPEAPGEPAGPKAGPIAVRKDFDPLVIFAPELKTDASGKVRVPFKMRDNLTRYRVVAVALAGDKFFGKGESTITARLPLMVRMSPPRFLNFGDRFELPVVLQNQTDKPMSVQLALRATNAELTGGKGRSVTIPANDRVEVRLPMAAAKPGTARFQAGAVSGNWADAAEVKLPVWTPATTEAFATYGEIDNGGIKQPVKLPGEVVTAFGGLEVQTSSTQLQALTDAVVYLVTYPFECSEQIASRMMSLAALKDVLSAFKAEGLPKPEVLLASVATDIKRLKGMQAYDGGFAFWRRDQETWPFLTVHVTHALLRAREKGFEIDNNMIDSALGYLRDIRSHMNKDYYTEETKRSIESFALYVRARANDVDGKRAAEILKAEGGADKANLELVGWLYPVFMKAKDEATLGAIRKHLNNRVSETAGAAHFVTSYGDGAYLLLHSDRRVDGLLLEGLIDDQPKSDLITKIVRGLLGHKTAGRWESTQENAWVLLGLDHYFNVFEKTEPNFTARIWLGNLYAGDHLFKGRTTERYEVKIPMQKLADLGGAADLTLFKEGAGRMYYRLGMRYAPKSLKLEPSEHGFHVERLYEAVDDPKDVTKDAEGRWVVKAGARVRVKLTMHTEDRRYHVALVDPMPAGFEALNPELKGTQAAPGRNDDKTGGLYDEGTLGRGRYYWWWGPWYQHENLRDERAEAFTTLLWEGVYNYTYYTRATTPGEFVVPPTKAEEMYAPETFGRGASDVVIVR
ncbi:MAG: Ig-like domain-containing protein [Deltaproteobacteria bacterium]|nr:Ig-like domain-containing protein [Deltaproteobacteria bacterium]